MFLQKNIILDTDISNEIDDQFALAYIVKSKFSENLSAITLAPYDPFWHDYTIDKVMDKNIDVANNLLKILKFKNNLTYAGCSNFLYKNVLVENEAVDKIIEIASKDKVTIISIAALTNIAAALIRKPEISKNIYLIWLGGHDPNIFYEKKEFNLRQDIYSAKIVFKYIKDLIIIPSKTVGIKLQPNVDDMKNNMNNTEIGKYLFDIYAKFPKTKNEKCKVLWDVAAVAFFMDSSWFKLKDIELNGIDDNGEYIKGNDKTVKCAIDIDKDKVFDDFYKSINK